MALSDTLSEYIRACFTGIWITSHEHDDAVSEIAQLCREQSWSVATWDIGAGLQLPGAAVDDASAASTTDPLAALRALSSLATQESAALLVLKNFHRFLQSPEVIQEVIRQITLGKQNRTFLDRPRTAGADSP